MCNKITCCSPKKKHTQWCWYKILFYYICFCSDGHLCFIFNALLIESDGDKALPLPCIAKLQCVTIFLAIFRFISKNHEYFRPFRECFNANTISLYNGQMSISVVNVCSVKVLLLILKVFASISFSFFTLVFSFIFVFLMLSFFTFIHMQLFLFLFFHFFLVSLFWLGLWNRGALLLENLNLYKIYYMVNVTHSWVCLKIHEQKRKEERKKLRCIEFHWYYGTTAIHNASSKFLFLSHIDVVAVNIFTNIPHWIQQSTFQYINQLCWMS